MLPPLVSMLPAALVRPAHPGCMRGMHARHTIRMWDRVQPSLWHPLASLEQSLMDVDVMARRVFSPRFPPFAPFSPNLLPKLHHDDKDFFKDLPIKRPEEATKETIKAAAPAYSASKEGGDAIRDTNESLTGAEDHNGHRIGSTRRRYEDSTGRLKATHEREMDGKKVKMVWTRSNTQDEGGHETICSSGSPDEFEKEWLDTPFGRAEDEELTKWIEDRERSVHEAFGIEYNPNELKLNEMANEERKVVQNLGMERRETIEKMSKRQEKETTPPQFTS